MLQRRPATVYVKKQCVKRKSIRCAMLFVLIMILLLCCGVNFLLALLLSGATVITIRILVLPYAPRHNTQPACPRPHRLTLSAYNAFSALR